MRLNLRQVAIVGLLLGILAGWAEGLSWILGTAWFPLFLTLTLGGAFSTFLHYRRGADWMARQLGAKPVRSRSLDRVYRRTNLPRKPRLYVTKPMTGANAFTISSAGEDSIFVTPEIYRAAGRIQEPVLAHEMAHIQHNDSFVMGFVSVFEQMIGNLGQLWFLLFFGGPFGWILLLVFWPFLLLVQFLSMVTLSVYQPVAALLLRQREYLADETAAHWTSVDQMKRALTNLEHYNRRWIPKFFQSEPGPHSTHPPLERRLERLQELKTGA